MTTYPVLLDPLVVKAAAFARTKHKHQKRLNGAPYFEHVEGAAKFVVEVVSDPEMVAAGYLHDTIEDTGVSHDKLRGRFGAEVARIVSSLSSDNRLPEEAQLVEYRARLAAGGVKVWIVKLADMLHNAQSLDDAVSRAKPDFEHRVIVKWNGTLAALKEAFDSSGLFGQSMGVAFIKLFRRVADAIGDRERAMGAPLPRREGHA